jgi:cytochrome c
VTPGKEEDGVYVLTATYTDKQINNIPSLSSTDAIVLRSSFLRPNQIDEVRIARKATFQDRHSLENILDGAHAVYKNIDLTGVKKATVMANLGGNQIGGAAEIHMDKADGPLLGVVNVTASGTSSISTKIEPAAGHHDLYIVFKNSKIRDKPMFTFVGIRLENR